MSLNLNWFKGYDTNEKHTKMQKLKKKIHRLGLTQIRYFLQNCKKLESEIFVFSFITFEPIKIKIYQAPKKDCQNLILKDIQTICKKWLKMTVKRP